MIYIAPQLTGTVLPAFVIGYAIGDAFVSERLETIKDLPQWFVAIDFQVGGHSTGLRLVAGAVLRIEANQEKGISDLADLVRGLKAMGEDPDLQILEDYPLLKSMVHTFGEQYSTDELKAFEDYLSGYLHIPPIQSGIEAYKQHVPCNPLDYFAGWHVMGCRVRQEGNGRTYFDDFNIDDLSIFDDDVYSAELQQYLTQIATDVIQVSAPPSVFMLWENSD